MELRQNFRNVIHSHSIALIWLGDFLTNPWSRLSYTLLVCTDKINEQF